MAIKLVDELKAMGNFPIAHAEGINLVKTDGTEDNLQNLFDNGELGGGGGDSSVTLTQQEYEALSEEQKLDGLYYTYDTKRIYKNGVQYGASDAEDIGYNNAGSGIQATTVQGAIDKVVKTVEDNYAKTTDIPTTLPANGGNSDTVNNHTVKSDVPENAVFTDTIYDDTELNAKLNGKADTDKVVKKIFIKDTSSQDARTLIQNHWSEFDNFEFYNLRIETAKWTWDAEIYTHTQEYGTVLLRSYGTDVPSVFYGKVYQGVWTWQELATMDNVANSIIRESKSVLYNLNNTDNIEIAIDIAKSGYKPIAVSLYNAGTHLWFAQGMYFNDTVCNLSLRGVTPTSATNAECKVLVTYIKTS